MSKQITGQPKGSPQDQLDATGIKAGQVYRHHGGGLCTVVALAILETTMEPLVVYYSNARGTTGATPLANWLGWLEAPDRFHKGKRRFQREVD
jgi:hypothetical protein